LAERADGTRLNLLIQKAAWKIHLRTAGISSSSTIETHSSPRGSFQRICKNFLSLLGHCTRAFHSLSFSLISSFDFPVDQTGNNSGLYLERYYWQHADAVSEKRRKEHF